MKFKKSLSLFLAVSQVAFGSSFAFADTPSVTPEMNLLINTISLQGQNLSQTQFQDQMSEAVSRYTATASPKGSDVRFQEALVNLNLFTPTQAQSFLSDIKDTTQQLSISDSQEAVAAGLQRIVNSHFNGAQFSGCVIGYGVAGLVAAGGAVLIYEQFQHQPTTVNYVTTENDAWIWGGMGSLILAMVIAAGTGDSDSCTS